MRQFLTVVRVHTAAAAQNRLAHIDSALDTNVLKVTFDCVLLACADDFWVVCHLSKVAMSFIACFSVLRKVSQTVKLKYHAVLSVQLEKNAWSKRRTLRARRCSRVPQANG